MEVQHHLFSILKHQLSGSITLLSALTMSFLEYRHIVHTDFNQLDLKAREKILSG